MISISTSGSFTHLETFLYSVLKNNIYQQVQGLAQQGVAALSAATPKRSGLTADSWAVDVSISRGACSIQWSNSNIDDQGAPIAILLQFGHGTGTGGYVQGQDYINPALKPVFDEIADNVWKAVTSA